MEWCAMAPVSTLEQPAASKKRSRTQFRAKRRPEIVTDTPLGFVKKPNYKPWEVEIIMGESEKVLLRELLPVMKEQLSPSESVVVGAYGPVRYRVRPRPRTRRYVSWWIPFETLMRYKNGN